MRSTGEQYGDFEQDHPLGAFVYYYVPRVNRDGKLQPPGEMAIYGYRLWDVTGGHMVIPVKWMPDTQSWDLQQPTVVTRLSVQDNIFPLVMHPDGNEKWDGKCDNFNQ